MPSGLKTASLIAATLSLGSVVAGTTTAQTATPERIEEVARRGAQVMPFDLKRTQHVFTKTDAGGVQQVIARMPADAEQLRLIREHLTKIAQDFSRGDFSDPARIHGEQMPGLAELRSAQPGRLRVEYQELVDGAQITYASDDPTLISAVHKWFDAQLAEHGPDAMPGHHGGGTGHDGHHP